MVMPNDPPQEPGVTELLQAWGDHPEALEQLMPLVAQELRVLAESHFRKEHVGHTLQPTALVNEVYLRLNRQLSVHLENRTQFFAFASRLMRRILVDHYRARKAEKRGGDEPLVSLDDALEIPGLQDLSLLALDDALNALKSLDPRQAQVVELRFFGGLTVGETASLLNISAATVKREWVTAKSFLLREIRR